MVEVLCYHYIIIINIIIGIKLYITLSMFFQFRKPDVKVDAFSRDISRSSQFRN